MSTQYLDGLGRPLQTVTREGSLETGGSATDIVKQVVYDEFGRESYKYLPYAASGTGSADGMFKTNALAQQNAFYSDPTGVLKGQNESFFYGKTNYEASLLGRVEKSLPPGVNWVGSNRGITKDYRLNEVSEPNVRMWFIGNAPGSLPEDRGGGKRESKGEKKVD